ncbi:hypothetical protein HPB48_010018 [Haemaphysalis longicornis]|uniref:Peptidase M13 N-terminal domain-containing protein n=1 Tax=Haemaphysalis longicornis TaxID=44386 RepID=A0A9J6GD91_HAELO|nr:hypothetical protein HPB48_010018 [Haemaphysalis longicornis]
MPFESDRWRPCRKPHILSDPTAKRLLCITIGCVLAGVCTYLASVTILSVIGAGIRPTACATQDCVQHALILLGTLNTSADPCVDFHAYVCGNDSQASRQASENLLYIKHIFPRISSLQSSPYRSEAAEVLSFNALQSCLNGVVGASAGPFVEFMAARKMPWPATDANRHLEVIDIFDILLDLAVNWRVGLWFDVTLYKKKDGPSTIVVGEPGALVLQRMEQLSRLDHPLYRDLVKEVSLYLSNGSVELSSSNIEEFASRRNGCALCAAIVAFR